MRFALLITSFVSKGLLTRTNVYNQLFENKHDADGFDHRYITLNGSSVSNLQLNSSVSKEIISSSSATLEELHKFKQNFYKLKLLNKLLNDNVSIIEKTQEVDFYEKTVINSKISISTHNLTAGGLFKDWDTII